MKRNLIRFIPMVALIALGITLIGGGENPHKEIFKKPFR